MPKKEEDEAEHPEMSDMRNVSGCESIKITVAGKGGEKNATKLTDWSMLCRCPWC